MDNEVRCRGCGESRPSDSPRGSAQLACSKSASAVTFRIRTKSASCSDRSQRACLPRWPNRWGGFARATSRHQLGYRAQPGRPRPGSPEMPDPADRSARLQLCSARSPAAAWAPSSGARRRPRPRPRRQGPARRHRDHPELVRRFVEEAQIAGQLQHPGIVPIYELGTFADRRPYFAMKLVKGRTLAALLADRKRPGRGSAAASWRSSSRSARRWPTPMPGA